MRIDASRGRMRGVSSGRVARAGAPAAAAVIEGVAAVADALAVRERQAAEREAEREEAADRVILSRTSARFREQLTARFDELGDGYDGSEPGFASSVRQEFEQALDNEVSGMHPRFEEQARIRLSGVVDNFGLAAVSLEDSRRDEFILRGVNENIDAEALAVQRGAALSLASLNIDDAVAAAPEALQAELKREAASRLGQAFLSGRLENAPAEGLEALQAGDLDAYLTAEQQAAWRGRLQTEIDRRQREADRQATKRQRVATETVKEELDDIERLRKLGFVVSDERYDLVSEWADAAGDDTREKVDLARLANRTGEEVARLPLAQAVSAISNMRAQLAAAGDVARADAVALEAAQDALDGMRRRLASDALGFAADHRGGIEPLDLSNPIDGLKKRAAAAREAAEYYGVGVRYFTNDELDGLQGALETNRNARALFVEAAAAAGAPDMLAELAPKAPQIAHLAGVTALGGDRTFVRDALDGGDLRRKGDFPTTVKRGGGFADGVDADVYGSAFLLHPDAARQAIAAARLAYDARSARLSRTADEFDGNAYEQALQESAGGSGEGAHAHGGVAVFQGKRGSSPRRTVWVPSWIRRNQFDNVWRALTQDDFAAAGGDAFDADGRPIAVRELKKGTPVAESAGVYRIDLGNDPAAPEWAAAENGEPYRLDFNKLRNPEKGN